MAPGCAYTLALPDGRTLAYSHSGPADATILVVWFHGLFSVGDAARPSLPIRTRGARYLAPTLPGWGATSPLGPRKTFPETVVADTRALLAHLYPAHFAGPSSSPSSPSARPDPEPRLRIYLAGGSFGTCPAQIVFGAPYGAFPPGAHVVACVLGAPLSPFAEHAGYARALSWRDWLGVGPPARWLPWHLLPRATAAALRPRLRTVEDAEKMLRGLYFDEMGEEEKGAYAAWRARNGVQEGDVGTSWAGFLGTADALHADWGFRIAEMDEEHARKRVVVMAGREDTSMLRMGRYLAKSYRNAKLVEYEGGHLAGAWGFERVWEGLFAELEDGGD
ncbi:Alpha/Beta hydrolase protein [Epithele typhae]|uniref:Alpha/Beta hydrolase protein n=1 Tax=Epithele typhae TaxID=378194 RepID=UPI002008C572|nr:Alpha/Beta hydrolase protein [Epithele typhae]KAH9945328.1 Alpha/Beta hydrolase protein [Epithele typhae]